MIPTVETIVLNKEGKIFAGKQFSRFSIRVYHLSTWSWEKSGEARNKLVRPLCWSERRRRAADYSWEHYGLNIQAQHLNMLLLLIYFIDIVWIEVNIQIALCRHAVSRLKNRSSQVTWILSPDPHFSPAWQLSQVLCKYRELGETNI